MLVNGTHSQALRRKALKDDVKLKDFLATAKAHESVSEHSKMFESTGVNRVS